MLPCKVSHQARACVDITSIRLADHGACLLSPLLLKGCSWAEPYLKWVQGPKNITLGLPTTQCIISYMRTAP